MQTLEIVFVHFGSWICVVKEISLPRNHPAEPSLQKHRIRGLSVGESAAELNLVCTLPGASVLDNQFCCERLSKLFANWDLPACSADALLGYRYISTIQQFGCGLKMRNGLTAAVGWLAGLIETSTICYLIWKLMKYSSTSNTAALKKKHGENSVYEFPCYQNVIAVLLEGSLQFLFCL